MFGTMAGGENPRPGGETGPTGVDAYYSISQGPWGVTNHRRINGTLPFGVWNRDPSLIHCSNKGGGVVAGAVLEAAERFTCLSDARMRHSSAGSAAHPRWVVPKGMGGGGAAGRRRVENKNSTKGMGAGGATGGVYGKPRWTKVGRPCVGDGRQGSKASGRRNR